jgi:hypothetical protein
MSPSRRNEPSLKRLKCANTGHWPNCLVAVEHRPSPLLFKPGIRADRHGSRNRCSCRQLFASLLADDVFSVPVRPILIALAAPLFVLAVCGRGTSECDRELG